MTLRMNRCRSAIQLVSSTVTHLAPVDLKVQVRSNTPRFGALVPTPRDETLLQTAAERLSCHVRISVESSERSARLKRGRMISSRANEWPHGRCGWPIVPCGNAREIRVSVSAARFFAGGKHPPLQMGWLQEVTHAETIPRVAARPCSGGSRSGRDWRYGVLSSVISMDRCNYDSGMARPTLLPPNCPLTL